MNILKEENLDKFKSFPGNRPVEKNNVSRLKDAIQTNNLLDSQPILINEKWEVLDGQHRLAAAKELEIPVFYTLKDGGNHEDVITLNQSKKNWKTEDFLRLYSDGLGLPDYCKLRDFMQLHNLKLNQALMIVRGPIKQMNEFSEFKEGKFRFDIDEEYLCEILEKVKFFWNLCAEHGIKPLHRMKNTTCLKPYIVFATHPQVNWEILKQKLEGWWYKIGVRPSFNLYIEMFQEIYNFRNQNKVVIS